MLGSVVQIHLSPPGFSDNNRSLAIKEADFNQSAFSFVDFLWIFLASGRVGLQYSCLASGADSQLKIDAQPACLTAT
jgi:hypothetical protein